MRTHLEGGRGRERRWASGRERRWVSERVGEWERDRKREGNSARRECKGGRIASQCAILSPEAHPFGHIEMTSIRCETRGETIILVGSYRSPASQGGQSFIGKHGS
jgi:hypothetical protein